MRDTETHTSADEGERLSPAFERRTIPEIGLVALGTDHAIEDEVRRVLPAGEVSLYVTRVPSSDTFDLSTLSDIADRLAASCATLLPETKLSAIAYGCTSGTVAVGEDRILSILRGSKPGSVPTTPVTAALAALKALKSARVSILTPYSAEVHRKVVDYFRGRGIEVVDSAYFGVGEDRRITQISRDSVAQAVGHLARSACDAVFVSCTALRIVDMIAELEAAHGKAIVTSNQALGWHCLRQSGVGGGTGSHGRLFAL